MQEYDAALKLLLQTSASSIIRQMTGLSVTRWLNVELPRTHMRRADLLGVTAEGQLIHIELQSSNDGKMALRMAEYALAIYRQFGKFPKQIVLYVGAPKLRMSTVLNGPDPAQPDFAFRYTLLDIRDLDSIAFADKSSDRGQHFGSPNPATGSGCGHSPHTPAHRQTGSTSA